MSGVRLIVRDLFVPRRRAADEPILDRVSLDLAEGARHGLIGGSGSGKSTLLRAVMGRVPFASGAVRVGDLEVPPVRRPARRALARTIAWIPQDAAGSLDPCMTARTAVAEALRLHGLARGRQADRVAGEALQRVGIPHDAFDRLPGGLSGGQAQRVAIARAMASSPGLVLADEPTSALDPLVQARILDLLFRLCDASGVTVLLVAHALGIVRRYCTTVSVLHEGRVVESGVVSDVLDRPRHPATRLLATAEAPLPVPGWQVPIPPSSSSPGSSS